jgi:hypothetical protein
MSTEEQAKDILIGMGNLRKRLGRAEAEIARLREALQEAVDWIEDDRFDDEYIMEDWYHKALAALREPRVDAAKWREAEIARLREALECMIAGACAVGVPHEEERKVLQEAVCIARAALGAPRDET